MNAPRRLSDRGPRARRGPWERDLVLDHLLYVGPDLADLVAELAGSSGLTAAVGGKHPGQGTHNALLGLGPDRYLELMAPDPEQAVLPTRVASGAAPPGTFLRSIAYAQTPQLFTWCAKVASAADFAARARALGLGVTVYPGSRVTPTGATLRWDLIILDGHGLGGVVPFFIDWHDSPYPAAALQVDTGSDGPVSSRGTAAGAGADPGHAPGLELIALELRHPDPAALQNLLRALGSFSGHPTSASDITIAQAAGPELVARLTGRLGPFALRGRGSELVTSV